MRRKKIRESPTRTGHDPVGRWGRLIIVDLLTFDGQSAREIADQTPQRVEEFRELLSLHEDFVLDARKLPKSYDETQVRAVLRQYAKTDRSCTPWKFSRDIEKRRK